MSTAESFALLSAKETAQLLGCTTDELDQLRRGRRIIGEPSRDHWWQFFPKYRFTGRAITDFYRSKVSLPVEFVGASPLVRIANAIMSGAIDKTASDIHIEPHRKAVAVRYRIHGTLHEVMALPKHITTPLLRRYLLMANADNPFDLSAAQTGIIMIKVNNRDYDVRVSSVPTGYGAKLVLRLIGSPAPTRWEELGISSAQAAQMTDLLQPGIPGLTVFATPQGEGLTTTLRCALYRTNRPDHNIYFFDDIADFPASGITRVLLDPVNGMTAAEAVRAARRQGAMLIVFAEITDRETARVAVETAESGLAVWAGVRIPKFEMTGAPRESVRILWTRFQGLGIAPKRLESVLRGAVMSRLIRTLCPDCKQSVAATDREMFEIETHGIAAPPTLYQATGCDRCRKTGYGERTGLFALHTDSPVGYDRSSFAHGAVSLLAAGTTDAAELRRLRVWPER